MKKITIITFALSAIMVFAENLANAAESATDTVTDCSMGSALDQYFCLGEKLDKLEQKMSEEVKKATSSINSEWGAEANKEIIERVHDTQKAWIKYRDGQCTQDYYTKASVHPPSQSLAATECKLDKTIARIQEIKSIVISK